MAAKSRYRKAYDSLFEAKAIAEEFKRGGNIDLPGPTDAWAEEDGDIAYVYVELAGNAGTDALAESAGWERVG